MATHQISILGATVLPDTTGRCFPEPYTVKAADDLYRHLVFVFNDPASSQAHGFYGTFTVPQNYVGTPKIKVIWNSSAISGNVKWDFDYRAVADNEDLDQPTTFQENLSVTSAVATTSGEQRRVTSSMTAAANFAAGDLVEYYLTREDGTGTDTMAAAATLHDLIFEYADA